MEVVDKYKCGEIFVTNTEKYFYLCLVCNEFFENINGFQQHNSENHFEFEIRLDVDESSGSCSKFDQNMEENKYEPEYLIQNDKIIEEMNEYNNYVKLESTYNEAESTSYKHEPNDSDGISFISGGEYLQEDLEENPTEVNTMSIEIFECKVCLATFDNNNEFCNHCKLHNNDSIISSIEEEDSDKCLEENAKIRRGLKNKARSQKSIKLKEKNENESFEKSVTKTTIHRVEDKSVIASSKNQKQKCTPKNSSENCCKKLHPHYNEKKCFEIQGMVEKYNNNTTDLEAEGIYFCKYCKMYFTEKEQLTTHITKHTDPGVCSICNKLTSDVRRHVRRFHLESFYDYYSQFHGKCKYCSRSFQKPRALQKHEKGHENDDFICKICGKYFEVKNKLRGHMRIHTGERPFKCKSCPAAFAEPRNLTAHHISKHTNDYNYPCTYDDCKQLFKSNVLRQRHIRYNHLKERNYQCEDCGTSFGTSGQLTLHRKKKHMDYEDRPYHCKYCDKKYLQIAQLKEHTYIHTGEKPFKCKFDNCPKAFTKSRSLSRHHNTHIN